ncbi:MAG: sugar ABC transporter permease [Thermobacillus sp. ZCTH02-B1]|uniref:sugar ABC transporter permease n=1 Tax=Thermobacillus sp. ZCTH02-B1 TaxID=1858795 RepID=UPI000B56A6A8|nr:sugar ABC transporter permease [Thermobacillus sp. ZCTH02-B1]OUM93871.1 MAG: sugar ABC transporter permease [Thermobacillus sp. ZCTH02-B1]
MRTVRVVVNLNGKVHARTGALLSLLFMGLGQIYNRQFVKGILYALLELYVLIFWTKPFLEAMHGLITLGETPQQRNARGAIVVQGDHSIILMITGIIFFLLLVIFLAVYAINVRDAWKVGKGRDEGRKPRNFAQSVAHAWEQGFAYILLTPAFVFVLFTIVLPLIFGILIAFTNYSGPNHLPPKNLVDWVGFETFTSLIRFRAWSNTFVGVLIWTIVWATLATFTTYFVGLFYALLLNHRAVKFKKFWRTLFILPWAVPGIISLLIFRNLFNGEFGPINQYLKLMGLAPIPWFSDPFWAKFAIVMVNLWFGFPYWMALMSGVLTNIDRELYEAAEIDGANGFQRFRSITLPLILFSTSPLLIMSFAHNFNNFNMIYLFTSGGPANPSYSYAGSTDILISWIYKLTLEQNKFNMASVVSIFIFIVVASFSIWNFRRTRAFKEEDMIQ